MAQINIDDSHWGELIGAAVMNSVPQADRDRLIQDAIQYLLTNKENSYYGKGVTPLQTAFRRAVENLASKIIEEEFSGVLREKISGIVCDAVAEITKEDSDTRRELTTNMAQALAKAFKVKDYY